MPEIESPSAGLKANARRQIYTNAPKLIFVSLFFVALITVISEFSFRLSGTVAAYFSYNEQIAAGALHSLELFISLFPPTGIAFVFGFGLLGVVVRVGLMSYCLHMTRGQRTSVFDILDGFLIVGKIILITFISSVFILLWSVLLIIPGIVAFYRYRKAFYILLDDPKKSAMQCIRESALIMHGNKLNLFLIDFSFAGWFVSSAILTLLTFLLLPFSLPLVLIWLSPYIGLSHAAFYEQLLKKVTA